MGDLNEYILSKLRSIVREIFIELQLKYEIYELKFKESAEGTVYSCVGNPNHTFISNTEYGLYLQIINAYMKGEKF